MKKVMFRDTVKTHGNFPNKLNKDFWTSLFM